MKGKFLQKYDLLLFRNCLDEFEQKLPKDELEIFVQVFRSVNIEKYFIQLVRFFKEHNLIQDNFHIDIKRLIQYKHINMWKKL